MMEENREEEIDLRDYFRILLKRRWTIMAIFALVVLYVAVHTFTATPIYRASSRIVIEKENPNLVSIQEVMAVGATGGHIMSQFLMESIVLSLIGGLLGVVLGLGGSFAMRAYSQWQAVIDPQSVLLAFSFSAAVGIFFGFYPARKASRMDPIVALRHE